MPTARELLAEATQRLAGAGVDSPRVDAEILLGHVLDRPRLMARLTQGPIPEVQETQFRSLLARREAREPLQHLTGTAPFRNLELAVGPGVFVPRPETELLVDAAAAHLRSASGQTPIVVDLCTGSGALALAMGTEVPGCQVVAVEVSDEALAWARVNVGDHAERISAVGSTLDLVRADARDVASDGSELAHLCGRVDVVLSNPPYVPDTAIPRDPEARDHDPGLALYGGPDGLVIVRALVGQAAALLRAGGLLVIEHADVQGEHAGVRGLPGLLREHRDRAGHPVWCDVVDHLDLAGRPRFSTAHRAEPTADRDGSVGGHQ